MFSFKSSFPWHSYILQSSEMLPIDNIFTCLAGKVGKSLLCETLITRPFTSFCLLQLEKKNDNLPVNVQNVK